MAVQTLTREAFDSIRNDLNKLIRRASRNKKTNETFEKKVYRLKKVQIHLLRLIAQLHFKM